MSKKSTPKKVLEVDEDDKVTYYLQHEEDFTKVMLMIKATRPLEFFEYLYSLQIFIDDCFENKKDLFFNVTMPDKESVH